MCEEFSQPPPLQKMMRSDSNAFELVKALEFSRAAKEFEGLGKDAKNTMCGQLTYPIHFLHAGLCRMAMGEEGVPNYPEISTTNEHHLLQCMAAAKNIAEFDKALMFYEMSRKLDEREHFIVQHIRNLRKF